VSEANRIASHRSGFPYSPWEFLIDSGREESKRRKRFHSKPRKDINTASFSGFTLLELMLTIALIALTATFVGLNVGQSDAKLADLEAKRFVALLNLALDESIVTGRPILLEINTGSNSYRFAPLDVPEVFVNADTGEEQPGETEGDNDSGEASSRDSFFKQRLIPDAVTIQFSRLPDAPDQIADAGFVPKRVHEILNKSLFDDEQEETGSGKSQNIILIEPNGLISPFTLSLSVDGRTTNVELDRFGKAALVDLQ
jgi:type II secretion system protein H